MSQDNASVGITKESIEALNKVLLKLPNYLDREKALLAAERKSAKVFLNIADRLTGSPGFFATVDNQTGDDSYIRSLNSTLHIATVKGTPPGVRVGFKAEKGKYVSYHANFLEGGTIMRTRKKGGGSTGRLRAYNLQKTIWDTGLTEGVKVLSSQLPVIVDRLYKKIYKKPTKTK